MTSLVRSTTSLLSISAIILGSLFAAAPANAETKTIPPLPPALQVQKDDASAQKTDRFIVKFSDNVKGNSAERGNAYGKVAKARGVSVKEVRETANGATVVSIDRKLSGADAKLLMDSFKSQSNVDYVEPDALLQPAVTPNDPSYPTQWDLFEEAAGLRLPTVWDKTTGAGQVVAVIDTGILPHSDLDANVLPGYDMISDAARARDGDGRDANPRDEGDWRASGDCGSTATSNSSWHGTHVAGTVAAVSNNGKGVSGIAPSVKLLPVRSLGLCGGYSSDTADAIIWASGGSVAGVPANANPARIINLSLGGPALCSITSQIAIDTAVSRGATVFAAAGNDNYAAANNSPANCNNVVVVGATGRNGNRAYYSNYGTTVDVMAPGGDSAGYILSTGNTGATTPGAETYVNKQGTSMATPHAAAVGALMLAADPSLTPANLEYKMKATARPLLVPCAEGCGTGLINPLTAVTVVAPVVGGLTAPVPTITGTAKIGMALTANPGTWGPVPVSLAYQWSRSGAPIVGATSSTYTATADDVNKVMTVTVTGSASGYASVSKSSIGTASVTPGSLSGYRPIVSGTVSVGSTLTATTGAWGPAPVALSYKWYRSGVEVAGATSTTYALTSADLGKTMVVRATGTKAGYSTGYLDSVATAAVTVPSTVLTAATPTIAGITTVGSTLTASPGVWGPAPVTLAYQWYRSGVAITGATAATYLLTATDQGKTMTVRVTGSKVGYTTATRDSAATASVSGLTLTSSTPKITGIAKSGSKLTATPGTWGPSPVVLSYQWYRSGVAITGATASTYVLTTADKGATIKVRVTGTKLGYTTLNRDSVATAIIK